VVNYTEWIVFNLFVIIVLAFDLYWSRGKIYNLKSSIIWTLIWTALAGIVNIWFFVQDGSLLKGNETGVTFLTAYIAERALSFDNLFVFIIIFQFFKIPPKLQPIALTYGIAGALVARAIFIAIGSAILSLFSWIMVVMGAFLIYTGVKIALIGEEDVDPQKNILFRISKKFFRMTDQFHGSKFISRDSSGKMILTPLFLVIVVLASTDVVFAIDSIPTVFGITQNLFIIWSSNMMAVIGMRPLYFLIQEIQNQFRFLKYGLAFILVFIGAKMGIEYFHFFDISIYISLGTIVGVIAGSILISSLIPEKK
jgi:tellurite resistance protein TerC